MDLSENDHYFFCLGSTRSANGLLMNMMMSDENHRDIYISTVAMPPFMYCPSCRDMAIAHPGKLNMSNGGIFYPYFTLQIILKVMIKILSRTKKYIETEKNAKINTLSDYYCLIFKNYFHICAQFQFFRYERNDFFYYTVNHWEYK